MYNDKRKFTLRVSNEIMDKIAVIADKNKRSMNAHIEFLLEQCINEYEKENGSIKISHEE